MTRYIPWLLLLLLLVMVAFGVDMSSQCRETKLLLEAEKFQSGQRITELEKEVRILKQDLLILQEGYKDEE